MHKYTISCGQAVRRVSGDDVAASYMLICSSCDVFCSSGQPWVRPCEQADTAVDAGSSEFSTASHTSLS